MSEEIPNQLGTDPIWGTDHSRRVSELCEQLRSIGCVVVVWSAEDIQERYKSIKENEEWDRMHDLVTADQDDVPPEVYDITFERAQEILDLHKELIHQDAAEAGEDHLDYNLAGDPRKEVPNE